jgi:hypothetical protein
MEVLTLHLGRYTRQMTGQGIIQDDMLQQESRRLIYGCENPWNQTIFDNPEWLATFQHPHLEEPHPWPCDQGAPVFTFMVYHPCNRSIEEKMAHDEAV